MSGLSTTLQVYIAPELAIFGDVHHDPWNNFRLYGTVVMLVLTLIVAVGVKFVQMFAPISLACVIISFLSIIIGACLATAESTSLWWKNNRLCRCGVFFVILELFANIWTYLLTRDSIHQVSSQCWTFPGILLKFFVSILLHGVSRVRLETFNHLNFWKTNNDLKAGNFFYDIGIISAMEYVFVSILPVSSSVFLFAVLLWMNFHVISGTS